jgi:AcrR family transcriptional regulator
LARLTREQSRIATQEKLREAAFHEFAFTGFSGATIDRIAESAGYSRGAFYSNYESKYAILIDLMREQSMREDAKWHALIDAHGDQDDFFDVVAQRFETYVQESTWGLFSVEVQLQARRDPQVATAYEQYLSETTASMQELVLKTFSKAGKRAPEDLDGVTRAFYALAVGLVLSLDERDLAASAKGAGVIISQFLQGLLAMASEL